MDLSFADVTLYDGHTRSRQKGRLQITRTELSFFPSKAGKGRAVRFAIAHIEPSPRAVGTGWRLSLAVAKIEARVRVDQEQPAFDIAYEFGNRERERDEALQAIMIMARGAFGAHSIVARLERPLPRDHRKAVPCIARINGPLSRGHGKAVRVRLAWPGTFLRRCRALVLRMPRAANPRAVSAACLAVAHAALLAPALLKAADDTGVGRAAQRVGGQG